MSKIENKVEIEDIIEIAHEAGSIAMQFYNKEYSIEEKENKTPVTEADIAIHNHLMEKLGVYGYPILSEEGSHDYAKRKNANFLWIIDPLDGTVDFIQKTGEFSIMIGLINSKGESIMGVVYAPESDELYFAEKEYGAFLLQKEEREKLKVSDFGLKNGRILVSRNHLGEWEQEIAGKYEMNQIPMGSAGLKICRIAVGEAELYINSSDKSGLWDICAADIILREAGGFIHNTQKEKIKYSDSEVILRKGYTISNKDYNLYNE